MNHLEPVFGDWFSPLDPYINILVTVSGRSVNLQRFSRDGTDLHTPVAWNGSIGGWTGEIGRRTTRRVAVQTVPCFLRALSARTYSYGLAENGGRTRCADVNVGHTSGNMYGNRWRGDRSVEGMSSLEVPSLFNCEWKVLCYHMGLEGFTEAES